MKYDQKLEWFICACLIILIIVQSMTEVNKPVYYQSYIASTRYSALTLVCSLIHSLSTSAHSLHFHSHSLHSHTLTHSTPTHSHTHSLHSHSLTPLPYKVYYNTYKGYIYTWELLWKLSSFVVYFSVFLQSMYASIIANGLYNNKYNFCYKIPLALFQKLSYFCFGILF